MRAVVRLFLTWLIFSVVFVFLRTHGSYVHYNVETLVSDLGGLTYLYSTVSTIFAVFAAFVVVSESQDWATLENVTRSEVNELRELFQWANQLPADVRIRFTNSINAYIRAVVNDEWGKLAHGLHSDEAASALADIHQYFSDFLTEYPIIAPYIIDSFNDIIKFRGDRINYSYRPMPGLLRFTVLIVDAMLILLSFFIGAKNAGLDYLFLLSIVMLGCIVFIVIGDLDNPLQPGEWYLTPTPFEALLKEHSNI
jgi:hypothetical protein